MRSKVVCPKCGTENLINNKACSACKSELGSDSNTTTMFIQNPDKLKDGPRIDVEGIQEGEKVVLVVKKGPILGQRLPIEDGDIVIGRDPKANIFLNDITVSRRHAKIFVEGNSAQIKDLGSLNGTYLNNQRFTESPLNNKDEIQIGKFILVFLNK